MDKAQSPVNAELSLGTDTQDSKPNDLLAILEILTRCAVALERIAVEAENLAGYAELSCNLSENQSNNLFANLQEIADSVRRKE